MPHSLRRKRSPEISKARDWDTNNEGLFLALTAEESIELYHFLMDCGYISHEFYSKIHEIHKALENRLRAERIINV